MMSKILEVVLWHLYAQTFPSDCAHKLKHCDEAKAAAKIGEFECSIIAH